MIVKLIVKLIYIALLLILFSCQEDPKKVQLEESFVLKYGEVKTLDESTGLTLSFKELKSESRCPADAECIWGGQAIVEVVISDNETQKGIELVKGELALNQKSRIEWANYSIELLNVMPYPEVGQVPHIQDYSVQLVIKSK